MIHRFTHGPPKAVARLNELADQANDTMNTRGDENFTSVRRSHGSGYTHSVNIDKITSRVPRLTTGKQLGYIVCNGPNGEPDYTNNQYWVQLADIPQGNLIDPIVLNPSALAGVCVNNKLSTIVPVTNLAEANDKTHWLKPGTPLAVEFVHDLGGRGRYFTTYADETDTGQTCPTSGGSGSGSSGSGSSGGSGSSSSSHSSSSSSGSSGSSSSGSSSGSGGCVNCITGITVTCNGDGTITVTTTTASVMGCA